MREIKFRAWDKDEKKIERVGAIDWDGNFEIITCNTEDNKHYMTEPDQFILMQYTGLKDKNKVEIYPDDIIRWDSGFGDEPVVGKVIEEWGQVGPCCGPNVMNYILWLPPDKYHPKGYTLHNFWELKDIEVIGNIYENPEILKEVTK